MKGPSGGSVLWPLAILAAILLGLVWLTGALSAAIFGEGWTTVQTSELVRTALSLPRISASRARHGRSAAARRYPRRSASTP